MIRAALAAALVATAAPVLAAEDAAPDPVTQYRNLDPTLNYGSPNTFVDGDIAAAEGRQRRARLIEEARRARLARQTRRSADGGRSIRTEPAPRRAEEPTFSVRRDFPERIAPPPRGEKRWSGRELDRWDAPPAMEDDWGEADNERLAELEPYDPFGAYYGGWFDPFREVPEMPAAYLDAMEAAEPPFHGEGSASADGDVRIVERPCATRIIRTTPYGRIVHVIERCGRAGRY